MAYLKQIILLSILLICVFLGLRYILILFMPFIIGYIISLILKPCVVILENNLKFSRGLASGFSLILFLTIVGGVVTICVQVIVGQGRDLVNNFDIIKENLVNVYTNMEVWFDDKVNILPNVVAEPIREFMNNIFKNLLSFFAEYLKHSPQKLLGFGKKFFSITLIGMISSFFFMKDREFVEDSVKKYTPKYIKDVVVQIKNSSMKVIGGYFATQLKLMSMTFSVSLISLTLLDVSYSVIFAIAIALVDILPFFGAGFFLWPMAVYYIFTKSYITGILLFVTYLIILFARQFLEPRLLGEKLEVHPILMLMSMFAGLQLLGIFGLIIGPLVMLILKQIFENKNIIIEKEHF